MTDFRERYGPFALVTGASSGIGTGFAEELAARGLDLVLTARRVDRLQALAARLTAQHGIAVTLLPADLGDPAAISVLLDGTAGLDLGLVVSNAGFGMKGEHAANDPAAMAEMITVNCQVPMLLAHGMIPRLRARGRGGILFTGSVEGLMACPYSTAYSATKALVLALGEGLWAELEPEGIDVMTLLPGATESEAAAKQGVDPTLLLHQMKARDVAALALDYLGQGPSFISSEHYRKTFEGLLAMPRRDALRAMANGMRPRS